MNRETLGGEEVVTRRECLVRLERQRRGGCCLLGYGSLVCSARVVEEGKYLCACWIEKKGRAALPDLIVLSWAMHSFSCQPAGATSVATTLVQHTNTNVRGRTSETHKTLPVKGTAHVARSIHNTVSSTDVAPHCILMSYACTGIHSLSQCDVSWSCQA
jgi:hypothetical protein